MKSKNVLLWINSFFAVILIVLSGYMIQDGYSVYAVTNGTVYGGSFSMLITLTN
ncbi:MAG: hypothetical protein ACYCS0_01145 [bacterium]